MPIKRFNFSKENNIININLSYFYTFNLNITTK